MNPTRRTLLAALGAASLPVVGGAATVFAQAPLPRPAPESLSVDTETLAPGGFVWQPELSPDGPVAIIVSLPEQRVHVYRNGIEIGVSTCSTGKPGHSTPTGVFVILQKDRDHRSSTYNNAPMPNMQRLTWDGVALHAGNLPGYPASHGCVRLPLAFSQAIFGVTHLGVPVIIADEKSAPEAIVHPGLLLPPEAEAEGAAAVAAAAARSHHGPDATTTTDTVVSIIVSGADRTAALLRNGEEVWTSGITVVGAGPLGSHVYKLLGPGGEGGLTWLAHRIEGEGRGPAPAQVLSRIAVEDWIGAVSLLADVRPGATLVVTDLSAGPDTRSGPDFVILRTEETA